MLKTNDELRKDLRVMELNSVVNQYLQQDLHARQRRLNIRTYAIVTLDLLTLDSYKKLSGHLHQLRFCERISEQVFFCAQW